MFDILEHLPLFVFIETCKQVRKILPPILLCFVHFQSQLGFNMVNVAHSKVQAAKKTRQAKTVSLSRYVQQKLISACRPSQSLMDIILVAALCGQQTL